MFFFVAYFIYIYIYIYSSRSVRSPYPRGNPVERVPEVGGVSWPHSGKPDKPRQDPGDAPLRGTELRLKMAKMRLKLAKMRPKMPKMRPEMAKMRPKMAKSPTTARPTAKPY